MVCQMQSCRSLQKTNKHKLLKNLRMGNNGIVGLSVTVSCDN